ncbi:MAG: PD-(D/E)XK nuclease family protein, partial [Candidatus Xenobia bacterium]
GQHHQRLLSIDAAGGRNQAGIQAHEAWQQSRRNAREQGARPELQVVTVKEEAERAPGAPTVTVLTVPGRVLARPHGERFGTLVHAVLAAIPLQASPAQVAAQVRLMARQLGAPPEEMEAATACVIGALASAPVQAAAGSLEVRREVPIAMPLEDGRLLEGVIDLTYQDQDGWMVIDFKSDLDISGRLAAYQAQVALYVAAVTRSSGLPARGVLLQI